MSREATEEQDRSTAWVLLLSPEIPDGLFIMLRPTLLVSCPVQWWAQRRMNFHLSQTDFFSERRSQHCWEGGFKTFNREADWVYSARKRQERWCQHRDCPLYVMYYQPRQLHFPQQYSISTVVNRTMNADFPPPEKNCIQVHAGSGGGKSAFIVRFKRQYM